VAETSALLVGSKASPRDPRELVPLLLAGELPAFRSFLQGELRTLDRESCGTLWPTLLEAILLDQQGYTAEGIPLLEGLAARYPDCLPIWDRIERLAARQLGSPDHPRVLELHEARLEVVSHAYPDGPEAQLLEAMRARRAGQVGAALRLALALNSELPDWYDSQVLLARLHTDRKDWEAAQASWRALLFETERAHRVLPEYLAMLRAAHAADPTQFTREVLQEELEALGESYPRDPRIPLAEARLDLTMDPNNPAIGVARALTRLDHFRSQHPRVSLEELQRDSTAEWAELYVEIAPSAAVNFLSAELELQPGDRELWRLLGRVHRDLGEIETSIYWLVLANRISPDPEIELEFARTLIASGADTRAVNSALRTVRKDTSLSSKIESALLLAEAQLNQTPEIAWAKAVDLLEPVWDARSELEEASGRSRLALLFARGLLLRDTQGDAQRAESVLEESLRFAQTPYEREMMAALTAIARALAKDPS
jgi:tetratricopeptide (TPR) repeat protein